VLAAAASILLFGAPAAKATPITYDFTVTGTSGSLNGTVSRGSFSYYSSSIGPGGGEDATGFLTGLSFSGKIALDECRDREAVIRADRGGHVPTHSGGRV
jgi:hypothetical protein